MGWLRAGVGLVMMTVPGPIVGISKREPLTQTAVLLLRTIGIRDLALGAGAIASARSKREDDLRRWTLIALASDSMDVLASLASRRSIGIRDSSLAALLAMVAVAGDLQALTAIGTGPTERITGRPTPMPG